jgi:hypothetical protein
MLSGVKDDRSARRISSSGVRVGRVEGDVIGAGSIADML